VPHRKRAVGGRDWQLARVEDHAPGDRHELGNFQFPTPNSQGACCRDNRLPRELVVGGWESFRLLSVIILDSDQIERLLPMSECIGVMEQALADLERGAVTQPLRSFWLPPGVNGATVWMSAHRSAPKPMFGTKLLFVLGDNPSRGLDSHQGQVILADGETGQIRALLDASAVTGIRTAAVSALATRLLAREDASILAIVGTGIQARKHVESITLVRKFSRELIAG